MKSALYCFVVCLSAAMTLNIDGCETSQPTAVSGVSQATAHVQVGVDGLSVEQRNVKMRLEEDNRPGSIKHLYVISPYSGQVILYSTVKGKVTSGGKRLTPTTIIGNGHENYQDGFPVSGLGNHETAEVLQDDGTYGQSGDYLYWWDLRGVYHQHYLTGGQIVHVSSQPIATKTIILNLESQEGK